METLVTKNGKDGVLNANFFLFWNSKLIITLGKKQKRENESSDEPSDAEQVSQHMCKDQHSQVSMDF